MLSVFTAHFHHQTPVMTMKTTALNLAVIILCFYAKTAAGDVISLYDSSSASIPTAQGSIYLTDPLFLPEAQMALVEQGTELNSLPNMTDKAGFFSSMPPLPAYCLESSGERRE